ncbi:signal peptide containing protein [Theileria equi strain WA]|uniref:Signal peptide containing protein n=1 Tax=Theileria equi strain WA TaxID=1537102 RepID=L1LCF0_THEEQ|nr:signal peptide containing protein [Theileria equi strain WA]EKX73021.1 signal peptide containing protein [Theileria equi strain WA]|eukprot:XP_004832473.1 signal peptide containing protein [Theileria equi strain WA]
MVTVMQFIGPLPIFCVSVLLFIFIPAIHAVLAKKKIEVPIDLSGGRSARIEATPSKIYPGGVIYAVQMSSKHTHVIGDVFNKRELILPAYPTALSRSILIIPRDRESYIRIITRRMGRGNLFSRIDEFSRLPNGSYGKIYRRPIEINLQYQEPDDNINVDMKIDPKYKIGGIPEDLETLPIRYSVKPEVDLKVTIGVIRFGDHIVDDKVGWLLNREVIWEGGVINPEITVTSIYSNERQVRIKYGLKSELEGFHIIHEENVFLNLSN